MTVVEAQASTARQCAGCGVPLQPSASRPRKWCSNRCRKYHTYVFHCEDCGKRLSCSDTGSPPKRCVPCSTRTGTRRAAMSAKRFGDVSWNDEAILDALRAAGRAVGEPLTVVAYRRWRKTQSAPTDITAINRFDGWIAACERAGVTPGHQQRKSYERITRDGALLAVSECIAATGDDTPAGYDKWASMTGAPSISVVRWRVQRPWLEIVAEARERWS